MPELPTPVAVAVTKDGTARFTLTCGDCGSSVCLTVTDVPPFTLKVAQTLFSQAMASEPKTTRFAVKCSSCSAIAARLDSQRASNGQTARAL